jgi:hypothetical protein
MITIVPHGIVVSSAQRSKRDEKTSSITFQNAGAKVDRIHQIYICLWQTHGVVMCERKKEKEWN